MSQSPELTGGAGFTFEDTADAFYLACLLADDTGPGVPGRTVVGVAAQQAAFGEPLDDLIVDARAPDGSFARLSLQSKRELTISGAPSNSDFREIVLRAWDTLTKADFREDVDRVGALTGTVAEGPKRALIEVCELARASTTPRDFFSRFTAPGFVGESRQSVMTAFKTILHAHPNGPIADDGVFRILRHFVLIHLDVLHEGSTHEASVVGQLRRVLHPSNADRADDLWHRLRTLARDAAGRATRFTRSSLINDLRGNFRFSATPGLQAAIGRIDSEAELALAHIASDVDGVEIERKTYISKVEEALGAHRFVHLVGLPGSGKSAVLRSLAERYRSKGTVFVIKTDRMSGSNWASYASGLGLPPVAITPLLTEIAATGTPILFVDGIDRVEVANRNVIVDLVNTILHTDTLASWKIVVTARDSGIEPLRTWLPPQLFREHGIATVEVRLLDDDEAEQLALERPVLRPLLFGIEHVREIVRRPFFAAVLARSLKTVGAALEPTSEVGLIAAWWARGGYDADSSRLTHRQRTLIHLAKAGANNAIKCSRLLPEIVTFRIGVGQRL